MCLDRRKAKRTQQQQHGLIADLGGFQGLGLARSFGALRSHTFKGTKVQVHKG
jgi:hypothetical protein